MSLRTPLITTLIMLAVVSIFAYARLASVPAQTIVPVSATASALPTTTVQQPPSAAVIPPTTAPTSTATLKVGTTTLVFAASPDETVIDAMRVLSREGTFAFTGREYPELGFFIESINGEKNADGTNWFLYVNGTSATSGASSIRVHAGDVIEWKYKKSY